MAPYFISREARRKIAKHSWALLNERNRRGHLAYGFLIGSRTTIYAALPIDQAESWTHHFSRQTHHTLYLPKAESLAKIWKLDVMGTYASNPHHFTDETERFPLFDDDLHLSYEPLCCYGCSGYPQAFLNGAELPPLPTSSGKRFLNNLNQGRLISHWNHLLNRSSSLHRPNTKP